MAGDRFGDNAKANAALVAAAPDLLEVARMTVLAFDEGPSALLLNKARAAIAKATGVDPSTK